MRLSNLVQTTLLIIAASCGWLGCDTANNLESPLEQYFIKYVGSDGDQWGVDMAVASDGSVYVLGNTTTPQGQQLYVARMTPGGMVVWARVMGEDVNHDEGRDIELVDGESALAILGMVTDNSSGNRDFTIRLLSIDNVPLDSGTFGSLNFTEEALSITEISDGYIVSGYTDDVISPGTNPTDAMFKRFDWDLVPYSTTIWAKDTYGGVTDFDVAVKTIERGPNFYVFGYSNALETDLNNDAVADNNAFVWIIGPSGGPINPLPTIGNQHFEGYDPSSVVDERVTSVAAIPGFFLVSGYAVNQSDNSQSLFVMRIRDGIEAEDAVEDILSFKPRIDAGSHSVISSNQASIYPSRLSGSFILGSDDGDIYLKKLDIGLNDEWTAPPFFLFGGVGDDLPGAVAETSDGRILVLGTMVVGDATDQKKMVLIKLSPNGRLGE